MKITARQIQLRNCGQLAQTTKGLTTYMGRLDSVVSSGAAYDVTIGGHLLKLDASHPLEIRRTPALDALVEANWINEDIADLLEEVTIDAS